MLNKNYILDNYLDEYGFLDNNIIKDIYEEESIEGSYLATLTELNRTSGEATVHIPRLNFIINGPLVYQNSVKLGDTVLVHLDNDSNGKITSLHTKSENYKNDYIENRVLLKFGNSELQINNNNIKAIVNGTEYEFNNNSLSILQSGFIKNFGITLPSLSKLNVQDFDIIGSSIDIKLGSLNGLYRRLPFSSTRPSGFSISSLFGNIDMSSVVGAININSMLSTNISSGGMVNIISGMTVGIMTPFISNLTLGAGLPLVPSPAPAIALPEIVNNMANPFRTPLLTNSFSHVISKVRSILP